MLHSIITSVSELERYLKGLNTDELCVLDTETTDLKVDSTLLGVALYDVIRPPCYVVPYTDIFKEGIPHSEMVKIFNRFLPRMFVIGHNFKYDLMVLKQNGMVDPIVAGDSMIAIHLHDTTLKKKLETRVKEDLGIEKKAYNEIIGKKWDKIDWVKDVAPYVDKKGVLQPALVTIKNMGEYACEDVYYTYQLWKRYEAYLDTDKTEKLFYNIELPLSTVLRDMKYRGVLIDKSVLADLDVQLDAGLNTAENAIYDEAGCQFNLNSPKQKADVLFNRMGLPQHGTTKTGAASTDKETFEWLAAQGYPIGELFVNYSRLNVLSTNFVKAIPKLLDGDGCLRGDLNAQGTDTGRFSSSGPNLQNQPNDDDYPVRKAFIARPGYNFVIADYSQIELRMMAHVSGDPIFCKAFADGLDIHQMVADSLGITRQDAKIVNFAVLYGMGPISLSIFLKIPERKAKLIIEGYSLTYKGYANWKHETENFARQNRYVKTIFGRIRRLPHVQGSSTQAYYMALRQACNTIIQGSSADLIKYAMVKYHEKIAQQNLDAHLMLQVHDELATEVSEEHTLQAAELKKDCMINLIKLNVPLEVDLKICSNWAQMKDKHFHGIQMNTLKPLDLLTYGLL